MTKTYQRITLTLTAVLLLSITSLGQVIQTVSIGDALKKSSTVHLSDLASDIEYIQLETNDQCLLGQGVHLIAINNDDLIVPSTVFYRFGTDGKFKNRISRKGKGPGEFVEIGGYSFDSDNKAFYVIDRLGKVMKFSLDGQLISEHRASLGLYSLMLDEDRVFNFYPARFTGMPDGYRVIINDLQGEPLRKLLTLDRQSRDDVKMLSLQNSRLYQYEDSTTIWEGLCDTVYRITSSYEVIPRYIMDLGKRKIPGVLSVSTLSPDYRKERDKYCMLMGLVESEHQLFLEVADRGEYKRLIWNKHTETCGSIPKDARLFNDIDGGPDFWPMGVTRDGRMFIILQIPFLKEYLKLKSEDLVKYPDRQREFKRMLDNCNLNDNPIIMLISPKK